MTDLQVTALIDGVRDNGRSHKQGETFGMEESLVGPHVAAGQVKMVKSPANKQAKTTNDK